MLQKPRGDKGRADSAGPQQGRAGRKLSWQWPRSLPNRRFPALVLPEGARVALLKEKVEASPCCFTASAPLARSVWLIKAVRYEHSSLNQSLKASHSLLEKASKLRAKRFSWSSRRLLRCTIGIAELHVECNKQRTTACPGVQPASCLG